MYPFRYKAATTPSSRENSIFAGGGGDWKATGWKGGNLANVDFSVKQYLENEIRKRFVFRNDLET